MSRFFVSGLLAAALVAAVTPASASDVTYDKLAYLTFNVPVQIPGATLGAGTYRFHLTNPESSRSVLQVLSTDGAIVYAMFSTIPDRRSALTADPVVTFRETPAGVPPAVRTLFYGGEYLGYEFIYPEGGPNVIPEVFPQPAITYMAAAPPPPPAPEPVIEPAVEAVEPAPVVEAAQAPLPEPAPAELPRTASPLPVLAVGGLGSLLAGLGLTLRRRRA